MYRVQNYYTLEEERIFSACYAVTCYNFFGLKSM